MTTPERGFTAGPAGLVSIADLERSMLGAWPAPDLAHLGDWVLRAADGFTHRANSALALGEPGMPPEDALDAVATWYHERGLAAMVTVPGPLDADADDTPVGALLRARGLLPRVATRCLVADTADVLRSTGALDPPPDVQLGAGPELTDAWFTAYRRYREAPADPARAVLTGSPAQVFATATSGPRTVAVGRLGIADGWGGVAAMWTDPAHRRRGLAGALLGVLASHAAQADVPHLHLQTDVDNPAALATYRRHGFVPHHDYVTYRAAT
jgi:GNAT superfamily N-acetyltransferase